MERTTSAAIINGATASTTKEFGYYVFDETAMERHLPAAAFKRMKHIIRRGGTLDPALADSVAFGLKEWAMAKGATCFCHWFHPLTGKAAHKFDAFLTLKDHLGGHAGGRSMLSQFSGRQLAQGESDGSSFPSGGLRRTSEARGYTGWDVSSPPFVVVGLVSCLYVPAVFCSIFGLSLDQRTPMLRSEHALSEAALRSLRLIASCVAVPSSPLTPGSLSVVAPDGVPRIEITDVYITVGAEQEMFIIDRELYKRRPDLVACGRMLLGGPPIKG
jgi:glutamine synthetase